MRLQGLPFAGCLLIAQDLELFKLEIKCCSVFRLSVNLQQLELDIRSLWFVLYRILQKANGLRKTTVGDINLGLTNDIAGLRRDVVLVCSFCFGLILVRFSSICVIRLV